MLRATHRVLKRGGRLAFTVLAFRDGITDDEIARTGTLAPELFDAGPGYPTLLEQAGFADVAVDDVTPVYRETVAAWIRAWRDEGEGIEELVGTEEYEERRDRMNVALAAIDEGLRKRYLVTGVKP